MSELFVMRRADGHFFTEEINGRLRLPVWSGEEAVLRYRERNPELGVFLPQRFSRVLLEKLVVSSGTQATPEFFLLSDDDPDADLEDGRPVSLQEVFPEGEVAAQTPHSRSRARYESRPVPAELSDHKGTGYGMISYQDYSGA